MTVALDRCDTSRAACHHFWSKVSTLAQSMAVCFGFCCAGFGGTKSGFFGMMLPAKAQKIAFSLIFLIFSFWFRDVFVLAVLLPINTVNSLAPDLFPANHNFAY
jgi:hypothetical protein